MDPFMTRTPVPSSVPVVGISRIPLPDPVELQLSVSPVPVQIDGPMMEKPFKSMVVSGALKISIASVFASGTVRSLVRR
jgi:hypothetical protein